eukprot:1648492-Amphidinium_carterae.1
MDWNRQTPGLTAWSKLWRHGRADLRSRLATVGRSWSVQTLQNIIQHCPTGKARGADRCGMSKLKVFSGQLFRISLPFSSAWMPVGQGALDETFDLAYLTEERSAAGQHQTGVFLDCSKCYERVPLRMLEEFALESRYPLLDRRILVQGAVIAGVQATCGLPLGCGHAVDMLRASLIRSPRFAGRQTGVDFPHCGQHACQCAQDCCALQWLCDQKLALENLARRLPLVIMDGTRSGLRGATLSSKSASTREFGLPAHVKARIVKSLFSVGFHGAEVGGISEQHMKDLRAAARGAFGK